MKFKGLTKFKEIWKVNLKSFNRNNSMSWKNQFILMSEEDAINWHKKSDKSDTYTEYSIDLTGDAYYLTEFYISEIIEKYPVNTLNEVLDFCNRHNIKEYSSDDYCPIAYKPDDIVFISIKENISQYFSDEILAIKNPISGLLVGGERDALLTSDLELLRGSDIECSLRQELQS